VNAVAVPRKTKDLAKLNAELQQLERWRDLNRLSSYQPYPKQAEFHAAGAEYRERLLRAGNQLGKTLCAAYEVAMHLTGRYPAWWQGKRFDHPTLWICGSVSGKKTRDGIQKYLLGQDFRDGLGKGSIPYASIVGFTRARGTADLLDKIFVRHVSGGESTIILKSYEQGREDWQTDTAHGVWFDEEPPADIYFEGITRTNVHTGPILLTFTPLNGMSAVVRRYLEEKFAGTHDTRMGIRDAQHYTEAQIEAIIASYPDHERDARTEGEPTLGSGAVFPVADEQIRCEPFAIPDHWPRIAGLDFGWDHPTACVWIAWDRDADTVYLYDEHGARKEPVPVHASAIKARGDWIPVAWPHDGNNSTAIGPNLAAQYRKESVNMLHEHAQFERVSGTPSETNTSLISVEAGIQDMLTRMMTGRFKVFSNLGGWFAEKRLYRRENGKLIKLEDDHISASRYGLMMLRYAATKPTAVKEIRRPGNWRT